ncbi:MAG: hypothetical protein ACR2QW_10980 [bacterium]
MARVCRWLFAIFLVCMIAGCSDDKSEVSSGGGGSGVESDGGASSAQFAGTYTGEVTILLSGGTLDGESSTENATVVIRTNGTASLTIEGTTVEGSVDGNRVGFSIRISRTQDLLECQGDAVISGILEGRLLSGTVTGSGECELIAADTNFGISGSLMANKID